jgi:transposase
MEIIAMNPAEVARLEALQRLAAGVVSQRDVATDLRLSVRQIKRLWRAYRRDGPTAVVSKRRGRPSNRRISSELLEAALGLIRDRYPDFGPTFACQQLRERDGILVKRETLRKAMIGAGLWQVSRKRRPRVHPPRERRPRVGELVQGDGSPHDWFEGRAPRCSLLLYVDDASSRIGAGSFAPAESTEAYFTLTRQYVLAHGKPLAFYVDKLAVFTTTQPNSGDDRTQFARAMQELDIEIICANSPQAKGRVERVNRTLQDRLVKELRLNGISSIEAANAFLPSFLERYNEQFAVVPREEHNAHRALRADEDLERILCRAETRCVSKNLTFKYYGTLFHIEERAHERRLRFQHVLVRERRDGSISVEHRGVQLAFEACPREQRPTADAKDLHATFDRSRLGPRVPDPKKQRTVTSNHPWKHTPAVRTVAS